MKKKIQNPDILLDQFLDYQKWVGENPLKQTVYPKGEPLKRELRRPMTMTGFECYLAEKGVLSRLKDYMSNREQRYSDFERVCRIIKTAIRADQIEGGMIGIYNPSITARITGLKDKRVQSFQSHARV